MRKKNAGKRSGYKAVSKLLKAGCMDSGLCVTRKKRKNQARMVKKKSEHFARNVIKTSVKVKGSYSPAPAAFASAVDATPSYYSSSYRGP